MQYEQPKDYEDEAELRQLEDDLRMQEWFDQAVYTGLLLVATVCIIAAILLA